MDVLLVFLGVLCAAGGAELFVRAAVGAALRLRVPVSVAGVTVAAFATSGPEFSVSVTAALAGTPQIALGDALGSNVVNVGLILGQALLAHPIAAAGAVVRRDYPLALGVPLLIGALALDGTLSTLDGVLLLAAFGGWLALVLREALTHRAQASVHQQDIVHAPTQSRLIFIQGVIGLALLVGAGSLIVTGAKGIGAALGLTPFVVGATLVAIGTSTPELATTLVARLRGHDEVGLGNVLGSNIFNGLWIVGIAALIRPIPVAGTDVLTGLALGFVTVAVCLPLNGRLGRARGVLLLALYAVYVGVILTVGVGG